MNNSYHKNSEDYDEIFMFHLIKEVFEIQEMRRCTQLNSLRVFGIEKLNFLRGIYYIVWLSSTFHISLFHTAVFTERVGDDKQRLKKFRELIVLASNIYSKKRSTWEKYNTFCFALIKIFSSVKFIYSISLAIILSAFYFFFSY